MIAGNDEGGPWLALDSLVPVLLSGAGSGLRCHDGEPDEVARRLQHPKYTEGMQYVQSTLAMSLDAS